MPACLRYTDSDGEKRSIFLLPDGCAIGRRPSKHLICLDDPQVSAGHAWLELRDDVFWVSDMGSSSGTLVNDRRVMSSPLRTGDILRCGDTALRFEATSGTTRAPLAGLLFFSPTGQRKTAPLRAEGALLGSFPGGTLYAEHDSIARLHAFLYCDVEQWTILPIAPRHETQINGHSVGLSGTRLRAGDVIRCGALQARFVLLRSAVPKLSLDERLVQLNACPMETQQLSVNTASGLTGGTSSMLAKPSGLFASVSAPQLFGKPSGLAPPPPPPPPASGAHFLIVNEDGETQLLAIPEAGGILGRSRGCLISTEDPATSRQHARVFIEGGVLQVEDLSKDQGTWAGGTRLVGERRILHSGDLVAAGQARARFVAKDAQFVELTERYRPFRVRCPIGNVGPLQLYWADHQELAATVVLKVLPPDAPQHDRWLAILTAESRLLRSNPFATPTGGTLLRELPSGERLLSAPLGCGLFLSEFLVVYGAPPVQLALELSAQICSDLDRRVQRDTSRREGQLPLREVWLYADPLAPLGLATRLLASTSAESNRPSPILQSPETGSARAEQVRNSQVYVYGLLLYSLLSGSLPSYGVPSRKLADDLRLQLPAVLGDLLYELLLDDAERRPDPNHAQRWIADLRSVLASHV